jgi:hypothetical protein
MTKVTYDTIDKIRLALVEAWPNSFRIPDQAEESRIHAEMWLGHLRACDEECVLAAVTEYALSDNEWPPAPRTVRNRALEIAAGRTGGESGALAWERVIKWVSLPQGSADDFELTDLEIRALKTTGGSWSLKHADVSSRIAMRAHFVDFYDKALADEKRDLTTPPEVKALIERNKPVKALPKPIIDDVPSSAEQKEILEKHLNSAEVRQLAESMKVNVDGVMGILGAITEEVNDDGKTWTKSKSC